MARRDRKATYLDRLIDELRDVAARLDAILEESSIRHFNWNDPSSTVVVIGSADYGWGKDTPTVVNRRMELLRSLSDIEVQVRGIFPNATPDVVERLNESFEAIRRWVERDGTSDWSVPATIEKAQEVAAAWFDDLVDLLEVVRGDGAAVTYLVPDTNALIANPDLATYSRAIHEASFEVVLLPAVLSELDKLKDRGGQDVARKAQAFIRRVKGLRDKGRLPDGVALTRSITVRAVSREVDPSRVLEWLDPTVMDDRSSERHSASRPSTHTVVSYS